MKKIILFRHGKSRWDSGVSDYERDLHPSGIERTHKAAKELAKMKKYRPDKWYSSPARRAERTAEIASAYFVNNPVIHFEQDLYTFSFFDLLKFIKNLDDDIDTALFFGHNEAYTEFVNRMGDQYLKNLPTSGIAILSFDTNRWKKIDKGEILKIIKPKKL